jgi:hypothetical protein
LLSIKEYESLVAANRPPDIGALRAEFDELLAQMQTPENVRALEAAFKTSPAELGRLAVEYARQRR